MTSPIRRLGLIGLLVASLATLVPAATTFAADVDTSSTAVLSAERAALTLVNRQRANVGLVAVRHDSRLASIARARADYMARTGLFSHAQADGTSVFDLIADSGISWFGAGEIIAWNTAEELGASAAFAVQGWMNSSGHRAIVLSTGYNYAAFGLAISPTTGKRYWAGVFLKGPDRTAAWSKVGTVTKTIIDPTYAKVTVRWSGGDTRLQVLTAGLRHYQAQKRRDGGSWYDYGTTTNTSLTRKWSRGHLYEVRVHARDNVGNWGAWQLISVTP